MAPQDTEKGLQPLREEIEKAIATVDESLQKADAILSREEKKIEKQIHDMDTSAVLKTNLLQVLQTDRSTDDPNADAVELVSVSPKQKKRQTRSGSRGKRKLPNTTLKIEPTPEQ